MNIKSLGLMVGLLMPFQAVAKNVVITTGEWAPYVGEAENNKGFVTKIVQEALKAVGQNSEVQFHKWKKAMKLIEKKPKKYHASIPWFKNEERMKSFHFSDPIFDTVNVFIKKKSTDVKVANFADLKKIKLTATLGYSYGASFDKALEQEEFSVVKVKSDDAGFKDLLAGKSRPIYNRKICRHEYAV